MQLFLQSCGAAVRSLQRRWSSHGPHGSEDRNPNNTCQSQGTSTTAWASRSLAPCLACPLCTFMRQSKEINIWKTFVCNTVKPTSPQRLAGKLLAGGGVGGHHGFGKTSGLGGGFGGMRIPGFTLALVGLAFLSTPGLGANMSTSSGSASRLGGGPGGGLGPWVKIVMGGPTCWWTFGNDCGTVGMWPQWITGTGLRLAASALDSGTASSCLHARN